MILVVFGIDFDQGSAGYFHVELANPFGFVFVPSFRGFNRTLDPFLTHLQDVVSVFPSGSGGIGDVDVIGPRCVHLDVPLYEVLGCLHLRDVKMS